MTFVGTRPNKSAPRTTNGRFTTLKIVAQPGRAAERNQATRVDSATRKKIADNATTSLSGRTYIPTTRISIPEPNPNAEEATERRRHKRQNTMNSRLILQ